MGCNIQSSQCFLFFLVVGLASSSAGKLQDFGGLNNYISGSPKSNISVILISDVFGYQNPRLRELADKVAAAGFYAVLPDFFHGEPYVQGRDFTPWLIKHSPEKGFEDAKPLIEALKCKGITKIGIAGFCWGGKVAVLLSSNDYNQAAVLLHPSLVEANDIKGVKVPVSILGGELDDLTPPEKVKQLGAALKAKPEGVSPLQIDSFVKIFPGMKHGWTIWYNDTDTQVVKAAEEAQNDMLRWMVKYVK